MNRYLLLDIMLSNVTSYQEFNNSFTHIIGKQVLLIGRKWEPIIHQASKLLTEQNINLDYLDKTIFPNNIELRWPTAYYHDSMEMDMNFAKDQLNKLHGDKIRFVRADNTIFYIEIVKHVKGPISVSKLLKELDILGRNFAEAGFFEELQKQGNKEIYQVAWSR